MNSYTHSEIANCEVFLPAIDDYVEIEVPYTITEHYDPNYGADLDGRRGVPMIWWDSPEFTPPDGLNKEQEQDIAQQVTEHAQSLESVLDEYRRYF